MIKTSDFDLFAGVICSILSLLLLTRIGNVQELVSCAAIAIALFLFLPTPAGPSVVAPWRPVIALNFVVIMVAAWACVDLFLSLTVGQSLLAYGLAIGASRYFKLYVNREEARSPRS